MAVLDLAYNGQYVNAPFGGDLPRGEDTRYIRCNVQWYALNGFPYNLLRVRFNFQNGTIKPFDKIRSVYVDNTRNNASVILDFEDSGYRLTVQAFETVWAPVITNLQTCTAASGEWNGTVFQQTKFIFCNAAVPTQRTVSKDRSVADLRATGEGQYFIPSGAGDETFTYRLNAVMAGSTPPILFTPLPAGWVGFLTDLTFTVYDQTTDNFIDDSDDTWCSLEYGDDGENIAHFRVRFLSQSRGQGYLRRNIYGNVAYEKRHMNFPVDLDREIVFTFDPFNSVVTPITVQMVGVWTYFTD